MTIAPTVELDTERYVLMCRDLMNLSGRDFKDVLFVTAGQIISFCIKHTRAASRAKIIESVSKRRSQRFEFPGGEVISVSKRHPGHISFLDTSSFKPTSRQPAPKFIVGGKTWHDMTTFHWSDERWAKFQTFLSEMQSAQGRYSQKGDARIVTLQKGNDLTAALNSRGNAKRSWYQIAEAIGIAASVNAPEWVKSSTPQNGQRYQNGTARMMLEGVAAFIEMSNTHPAAIRMNGQALVNYAIIARTKAFEREVELGVFRNIKDRAARYPGLFVSN